MPDRTPAIFVHQLTRSYGSLRAVDGLSFEAQEGEVVGFIGANGAGKTTTMRILATLDMQDSGIAKIGGFDASDDPAQVRQILRDGELRDDARVAVPASAAARTLIAVIEGSMARFVRSRFRQAPNEDLDVLRTMLVGALLRTAAGVD